MNFIKELYYGNIHPTEKISKSDTDYDRLIKCICCCEEALNKNLTDENLEQFKEFVKAQDELSSIDNAESFCCGFKLGVQMIFDSLIL